MFQFNVVFLLM